MTLQPTMRDLFAQPAEGVSKAAPQPLPATTRQMAYAQSLAMRLNVALPKGIAEDRKAVSQWIDGHKASRQTSKFSHYSSARQVAFAEKIARLKRNPVPAECFRDRKLMSRWIDSNKP
jgi:hypothetical protein